MSVQTVFVVFIKNTLSFHCHCVCYCFFHCSAPFCVQKIRTDNISAICPFYCFLTPLCGHCFYCHQYAYCYDTCAQKDSCVHIIYSFHMTVFRYYRVIICISYRFKLLPSYGVSFFHFYLFYNFRRMALHFLNSL